MQLLVLYLIGGSGIPGHQNGVTWGRTGGAANPQLLCRGFERTWQEGQEASPAELALLGICALILRILYTYMNFWRFMRCLVKMLNIKVVVAPLDCI